MDGLDGLFSNKEYRKVLTTSQKQQPGSQPLELNLITL